MDDDVESLSNTIDMGSINNEIGEAVIVQLQTTVNRPHLIKELGAVLMLQLKVVQQSANPYAIISSRLASYLKRSSWSAKAPCPLAKELESIRPRRTYFYLTTCPHLPLPDPAHAAVLSHLAQSRTIISTSLSSVSSGSDKACLEHHWELSPSPEVDLSRLEFDNNGEVEIPTTIGSISLHGFQSHYINRMSQSSCPRRVSPPLDKDEKEFTQTADRLQQHDLLSAMASPAANPELDFCQKGDTGLFSEKMHMPGLQPVPFITSPVNFSK